MKEDAPVLISGGGLVGLSAAMFLAHHGVPSLVVEKLKATSQLPRAAFFHMRTIELFREAGIEDEVREQSAREFLPDGAVVAVESLAGKLLADFIPGLNEGVAALSPCRRIFVTQPGLEPILRRRAEKAGASVLAGHEVVRADQDAFGVTATVKNVETGDERQLRGKYLVAAEGARSHIREQLGIPMDGRGVFSNSVTIYFRADLSPYLKDRNLSVIYVNNPVLIGFFRVDRDCQRGFLAVNLVGDPKADPKGAENAAADTSPARMTELLRAAIGVPDIPVEIEGIARWRSTSDVAQRFQDRRVFLAGDTAHLMPPTGGFGGNTGIHDAHNLAWKLALVLNGTAAPALLGTYDSERRPAGKFTVEQAYTRYVTRMAAYRGAQDYQPPAHDFDIELGYLYRSPAIVAEPGAPEGHEDPRQSFGRPGSRAPHIWLEHAGKRISSLDLLTGGFVLLTGAGGQEWEDAANAAAAKHSGLKLNTFAVGNGELRDPDGAFHAAFGLEPSGASLIRPDGFVAWRAKAQPAHPAGELGAALAQLLMKD